MLEQKIPAIKEGTVIDHIPSRDTFKIIRILNPQEFEHPINVALNLKSKRMGKKGVIKIDKRLLTKNEVNKIAILAPNATVSIIKNYKVKEKIQVSIPSELEGIIDCTNPVCITNNEKVVSKFKVVHDEPLEVECRYCERVYEQNEVDIKRK